MKYKTLLFSSIAVFLWSAILFVLTLINPFFVVGREAWLFLLMPAVFIPFGGMIFSEPDSFGSVEKKKQAQENFRKALPRWAKYAGALLFVFVVVNMGLTFVLNGNRLPKNESGRYFLYDKDTRREIPLNLPEYAIYKARETRLMASFAMIFSFVPACYFGLYKSKCA